MNNTEKPKKGKRKTKQNIKTKDGKTKKEQKYTRDEINHSLPLPFSLGKEYQSIM